MAVKLAVEFEGMCLEDVEHAPIVPAIKVLLNFLKTSSFGSVQELQSDLNDLTKELVGSKSATIGVESACELFKRFITFTRLDVDLQQLKPTMISRGESFLQKVSTDRKKVAKLASPFILNGHQVMVHSRSRVVRDALLEAAKVCANFTVFVTSCEDSSTAAAQLSKELEVGSSANVKVIIISDAAVGYYMERTNLVLLGAEGIVESGGIINRIGSFQMAVLARRLNIPVFVLAESVKCIRLFPLAQKDLTSLPNSSKDGQPRLDYTPPDLIQLLITDLGTLTPSAVSDELIKLYL